MERQPGTSSRGRRLSGFQRIALGAIWLCLGLLKLGEPEVLGDYLVSVSPMAPHLSLAAAWAVILGEIALGIGLILAKSGRFPILMLTMSAIISAVVIVFLLVTPEQPRT